jgi:NADH oxidase (H2O2-forming)
LKHIVVIGFESAGLTAASTARVVNREANVIVIERRLYAIYHPCGIPFAIGGDIPHIKNLVEPAPRLPNLDVRTATEAISLDTNKRTVEVVNRHSAKREIIEYDALVLATGSLALKPPIPGVNLGNVHTVRTMRDGEEIIAALPKVMNAVVIGAGPIGIETAVALHKRGLGVTLIEMQSSVLPGMLDLDMSDSVIEQLRVHDIETLCGKRVEEICGQDKVSSVVVDGEEIQADLVAIATGVKPDIELAKAADIKVGPTGAIEVDDHLRTSAPDVYAAGDCAESKCFITKRPILSQLATTAIRMGKVAGTNAAGGDEVFPGVLNTVVTSAYELEIASTGLTMNTAKMVGMEPVVGRIRTLSRPSYYPGAEPVIVKLLVEPGKRKILGGQMIGDGSAERANMLALAIKHGIIVDDLARMEYCYAPPVCDCIEPLAVAAEAVLRKLQ